MTQFDDSAKEEIRSRIDIATVIGRYVNLKQSGQTLKGLCPFHKEKTPSFHVNPTQGFFHCFGCGKGGDVFSFLEQIEGIGFSEALSMLGEECGIAVKRESGTTESPQRNEGDAASAPPGPSKTELLRIHDIVQQYFYNNIKISPQAVAYFKTRGLTPEIVKEFHLGFALEGWTSLIDFSKTKNIPESALVSCGLAIKKDNGRCYDRFRNRIIFPLADLSGRVIGFAGRGMDDATMPKYLNSPETILYKKKSFLYGLGRARPFIKESGMVMVVEGYMDYLSLYQAGIKNVVASSGTALTPEHGQLIARFTKNILLLFDGDTAGQSAIEKAIFTLAPFNLHITTLSLPGDDDPDSFIKNNGREAFLGLLNKARTWSDFIIERMMLIHNASTPVGKSSAIEALSPLAASIRDPILAEQFKREIAIKLSNQRQEEEQLLHDKLPSIKNNQYRKQVIPLTKEIEFTTSLEGRFIQILLEKPEFINEARQYVVPETLTDSLSADIYSLILTVYDRDNTLHGILDTTTNPEIKRYISLLTVKNRAKDQIHEEFVQKIIHLRKKYLRSRQRECTIQLKQDPHRREELLRLLQDYTTQLHELDGGE
jgi:DNA primase